MENLTQMQRHIEALNRHIDQRAWEAIERKQIYRRSLWKTNLYWAIGSVLLIAVAIEWNHDLIANNRLLNAEVTDYENRLDNTVNNLRMVDEERNNYAEATKWFIEQGTPRN